MMCWSCRKPAEAGMALSEVGQLPVHMAHRLIGQNGISIAGHLAHGRSLNARTHCFRRKNLIHSAAHDLAAFACRFFEPRSVNLDQTPPIRSDSTRHPEVAHNMRHSRSS